MLAQVAILLSAQANTVFACAVSRTTGPGEHFGQIGFSTSGLGSVEWSPFAGTFQPATITRDNAL